MNRRATKLIRNIGGGRRQKRAWLALPHTERGKQRAYLEAAMREGYAPIRSYNGLPRAAFELRMCLWKKQLPLKSEDRPAE